MGCWNGSCALTGLPISAGEEVYAFLLVQTEKEVSCNSPVYAYDFYDPQVVGIYAKYDDYGNIEEEISTDLTDMLLKRLSRQIPALNDEEVCPDDGEDDHISFRRLGHLAREEKTFIKYYDRQLASVLVMVRADVLQQLKQLDIIQNDWNEKISWEACKAKVLKVLQQASEVETPMAVINLRDQLQNPFRQVGTYQGISTLGISEYDIIKHKNVMLMEQYAECIATWSLMQAYMQIYRRSWCPPSGAGSQDDGVIEILKINQIIGDIITKRERMWEDLSVE